MKIITECVISIESLEVVSEECYEYVGQLALCKGGGGGGGGSGEVSYPTYMEDFHDNLLGGGSLTNSCTAVMDAAQGNSPWSGQSAYDPDTDISAYETAISDFATILAGIDEEVDWASAYSQAETSIGSPVTAAPMDDATIVADVDAFADQMDDEITTKVLPRFRAGMRDINAVVSSAFPIGEAVIESFRDRDVAKHNSALRLAVAEKNIDVGKTNALLKNEHAKVYLSGAEQMTRLLMQRVAWEESYAKVMVEANRIKIVAKKEETDANLKIDAKDALWDLEVFQYGCNVLAAIGGGTGTPGNAADGPSTTQSMIGGAMSGAAAGAMIAKGVSTGAAAGPWGAVIGGVVGAASALLM